MFQAAHTTTAPFLAGAWHRAQPGPIVGPRHARPETGAARGCGPAASGEFDRACARCRRNGRSGRRNRCFDQTKEHGLASLRVCGVGHSLDTGTCPTAGGIENASHTEILTLPAGDRNICTAASRCFRSHDLRIPVPVRQTSCVVIPPAQRYIQTLRGRTHETPVNDRDHYVFLHYEIIESDENSRSLDGVELNGSCRMKHVVIVVAPARDVTALPPILLARDLR
jgi:hypothetical protein